MTTQSAATPEASRTLLERANAFLPVLAFLISVLVLPVGGFVMSHQAAWADQAKKNAIYDQTASDRGKINDQQDTDIRQLQAEDARTSTAVARVEEQIRAVSEKLDILIRYERESRRSP